MGAVVVHAPDITPELGAANVLVRTLLAVPGAGGNLVRKLVDIPPGGSFAGTAGPAGELWFVIKGQASLTVGGWPAIAAGPRCGLHVPAGASYRLRAAAADPVQIDAVTLPGRDVRAGPDLPPAAVDLRECPAEVTGDRRFRVLFGPGRGCAEATQFVGEIPPGRAPEHSHPYDEVVLVLAGAVVAHAGGADHDLASGSCVYLPPGTGHCLENSGPATLIVLGVFHPGGSPAAKTPAS